MPFYKIDSARDWEGLLKISVIDLTEKKAKQRVKDLNEKDTLILHARDGNQWDREDLLKQSGHPRVIVVTGSSQDELEADWSAWVGEYGAEVIFRVSYFAKSALTVSEEERRRYAAIVLGPPARGEIYEGGASKRVSVAELEVALVIVRSLGVSLRFCSDAVYGIISASMKRSAPEYDGFNTYKFHGFNSATLAPVTLPTLEGYTWADLFDEKSRVRETLLTHFIPDSIVGKALSRVIGRGYSKDTSRVLLADAEDETGGAIRFFYNLAMYERREQEIQNWSSLTGELGDLHRSIAPSNLTNLLEKVAAELSVLETSLSEISLDKAAKRHTFIENTLMPAEDVRADLHHKRLRQNVLQRLIGAETDASLTVIDEADIENEKFEALSGLLARADEQESPDSRRWAFEEWSGGKSPYTGVKYVLLQLFDSWRSEEKVRHAGLVLKDEIAELLLSAETAVKDIDSLIGSDSNWRKHQTLSEDERKNVAINFWKDALSVMQCLGRMRAAPLRLFEIYNEI